MLLVMGVSYSDFEYRDLELKAGYSPERCVSYKVKKQENTFGVLLFLVIMVRLLIS